MRVAATDSTWKVGVVPIASALARKRLDADRSPASTSASDTGALGAMMKWKLLSAGIGSAPAWIDPRTFGPVSVNCVKVTDPDACAATLARSV